MTYPLYAAGLLIFIYYRSPDKDRRSLIDALTLTAGLALLSWTFLIRPYVHEPGAVRAPEKRGDRLSAWRRAYPGAAGEAPRAGIEGTTRCVQLLTLGAVGCLVSDVAFGWVQFHSTFHNGTIIDLGWAVFYTAWGAAALHPSMATLTEPVPRQQEEVSPARLAVLMLASLIAPVVLLTTVRRGHRFGRQRDRGVSAVLYLLVLTRLWDAAASHHRALNRERALREAGLSLVTAADLPAVAATVKAAVRDLLGENSQADPLLEVRIDGKLRAAAPGSRADAAGRAAGQARRKLAAPGDRDHAGPHRDPPAARAGQDRAARR